MTHRKPPIAKPDKVPPILCPHCLAGSALLIERMPDPTRTGYELRKFQCQICGENTDVSGGVA